MSATSSERERHALIVHHDPRVADLLTSLFEVNGFDVVTANTGFRAEAYLSGHRPIDVVIASWEGGGDVYRWALNRRYDLRDRFVFVGADLPAEFDYVVAGRCLAVAMVRPTEIVRVAIALVDRRRPSFPGNPEGVDVSQPRLLLADDDPILLAVIGDLLSQTTDYAVTPVESGRDAIRLLEREDFEIVVADWHMDECSGADVFDWIAAHKPWLCESVVFLCDRDGDNTFGAASSRPMFRKGQDSRALTTVLREIVWQARRKAS